MDFRNYGLPMEPGAHEVVITGAAFVTSTQKGTPGIEVTLKNRAQATAKITLWLTEKNGPRVRQFLEAAGIKGEALNFDERNPGPVLKNKTLYVMMVQKDGKLELDFPSANPIVIPSASSAPTEPAQPAQSSRPSNAKPPVGNRAPAKSQGSEEEEDDLPF